MSVDVGLFNAQQWGFFKVKDFFKVELSKGDIKLDEMESGTVALVSSGETNNGVVGYIDKKGDGKAEVFPPNRITIDMFGNAFYQSEPFYAVSHGRVNILTPKFNLTKGIGLFISSLIRQEQYKYSYGRAVYRGVAEEMDIRLPTTQSGEPNWEWMENYIVSLHHKPLTTSNKVGQAPELDTSVWREFLLSDYFDIVAGIYHYPDEYEEGETPYISASNLNNGVGQNISLKPDFSGNKIITGKVGCTAFYQPEPFCATSDVNIFTPKFNMSRDVGVFLVTLINFSENYKWAYGRQCRVGNSKRISISLPATLSGKPDWEWMESYIQSLPYGDRLNG